MYVRHCLMKPKARLSNHTQYTKQYFAILCNTLKYMTYCVWLESLPRANSEMLGCCLEANFTIKDKQLLIGFLDMVPFLVAPIGL